MQDLIRLLTVRMLVLLLTGLSSYYAQTPPDQALTGPGGGDYIHGDVNFYGYDLGDESFWLFEPASPAPDSANVIVFMHGYAQINPKIHGGWIKHLVRKGNIVIYPKYQDDLNTPDSLFEGNAVVAIQKALDTLALADQHVRPKLDNLAFIGHSYGGIISANIVTQQVAYGLPKISALMVAQGYVDDQMRLDSYMGMPYDTKLLIIVGSEDGTVGDEFGRLLMDSTNIDCAWKNLVTHYPDQHGSPNIGATHEEPVNVDNDFDSGESNIWVFGAELIGVTNAVDYYCFYKLSEAMCDCAFFGSNCDFAFGNTANQRHMGNWSDGTPVVELEIETCNTVGTMTYENGFVSAYPNPVTSSLSIETDWTDYEVVIFDLTGKVVFKTSHKNMKTIDLTNFESSVYLMVIKTINGDSKLIKLLKY